MSIGRNIRQLREERHLTQEALADRMDVSFQAVSSWERDEYCPDTRNLIRLAEVLDVSVSAIVEDKIAAFETKETFFDTEHMKTFVKVTAKHLHLPQTLKALDYAWEAHDGQYRKRSVIPYIHHPLNMACHALAMNIADDDIIASCLLHDVVEDCGKSVEELPGNDRIKTIVRLLTHPSSTDENRDDIMRPYYQAIAEDPGAALVKCLDRCNNLTTMSWGLRRERIVRMIRETETYYPELWNTLKRTPEYNNAAWLLRYQTESMLDIYKRLL